MSARFQQNLWKISQTPTKLTLWFVFKLSTCFLKRVVQRSLHRNLITSRLSVKRGRSRENLRRGHFSSSQSCIRSERRHLLINSLPFCKSLSDSVAQGFETEEGRFPSLFIIWLLAIRRKLLRQALCHGYELYDKEVEAGGAQEASIRIGDIKWPNGWVKGHCKCFDWRTRVGNGNLKLGFAVGQIVI